MSGDVSGSWGRCGQSSVVASSRSARNVAWQETLAGRSGARGWGMFGWYMCEGEVAGTGAVRLAVVEWLAAGPGRGCTGPPMASAGEMQSETARRAGEPPGQGEEPPPEGLGGHYLLAQAEPRCPAGEVMRHHPYRQPSTVGGEAARGEMIQPHAVLEVPDGVLDLGVSAMISLQFLGVPVPAGDEAVIAVFSEEGQLGTGRGSHPPDDEPHRRGIGLTREGNAGGFGHICGAIHPVGNRRQASSGIVSLRSGPSGSNAGV